LNFSFYLAQRLTLKSKRTFSKLIVRMSVLAIALGVAVMILSMAIVKGFKQEIREKVRAFSGDVQVLKNDLNFSLENSSFSLPKSVLEELQSDSSLLSVQAFATKPGIIKVNNEIEGVVLKGIDDSYSAKSIQSILVSGRSINFADTVQAQKEILISNHTARLLHVKVGDDFVMYFVQEPLRKRKFTVVGVYNLGVEEVDNSYVIGSLSLIRRLNNWSDSQVGGYEIRLKDFNRLEERAAAIHQSLPIETKAFTVKELYPTIFQWLSLLDINTQVVFALMLAVALINMVSALLIMILERTTFIGLLKALGSSNWAIRKLFLYQAVFIIGLGLLLGNVLGLGIGFMQQYTHVLPLDEASYYMNFVPIQLEWMDVIWINLGTLSICLLVLLLPSLLISRIVPVKALRFS
jgi:lipoprotein-releasing system permease protein